MSVSSIGQSGSDYWLQQMLAAYGQSSATASQSSVLSLLSQGSDATDDTSATSSGSSSSATSSVGSFNDILTALLAGNGSLSYDMDTGMLVSSDGDASGGMPLPDHGTWVGGPGGDLNRDVSETQNEDGTTTRNVTLTDADGNQVGTEKTVTNADGSYTTTITMTDPSGKTSTRTVTGENTEDGFLVTDTLTASDGTVLESGTELTASDGSVTRTVTHNGPDGGSVTESASFDAAGQLVSSTTTTTASAAEASGTTTASTSSGSSSASGASGASGSSGSSSDSDETTTTISMTFTDKGIEETTTVTDADGNIVSQKTKEIPLSSTATGESFGSTLTSDDGLAGLLNQYAANRYDASRNDYQRQAMELGSQSGVDVQA